ncbi:hypothetical protein ASPZODRAFT_162223 [Penicilliopsis zonata CBS 506.65]|uniref:Peptidase M3A/M3B catalytic domain-containing protein n=1 Tax=Penicilliopsis zonata CBS 506.65 TaxID=1073090 RepID=A0A1L9S5G3_9EURO|nr:hypothetical protein ASPZODRAFT_162223 [Penicilliopsis zonata CBS 506.65]OJJ42399.1 hypothetical protein ASPZODRAFT_162223 [Penicilliopsis zonata CBS 506.65]
MYDRLLMTLSTLSILYQLFFFRYSNETYSHGRGGPPHHAAHRRPVQCLYKNQNIDQYGKESILWLEKELRAYTRAGHGQLSTEERDALRREQTVTSDLEKAFRQNLMQESRGVWLTPEEVEGVPERELKEWKESAELAGSGEDSRIFIPFANGGYRAILTHATSPVARENMWRAHGVKLPENVPILQEIVSRREAMAHLLGYSDHAAFRLEERMIQDADQVATFLARLQDIIRPYAQREVNALKEMRRMDKDQECQDDTLPPWDRLYYQRQLETSFHCDQEAIAEYFPLQQTATAMLDIFATMLNLRFDSVEGLTFPLIWHESVRVFTVWDGDVFLGNLYLNLVWREKKYRGEQCVIMELGYSHGKRQPPSILLMATFPAKEVILLHHHETTSLFHEMGHAIHNLLSHTQYARFHGTLLPIDFGEIPGMMLENWCWRADVLQKISCHYTYLDNILSSRWRALHPRQPDPPRSIPDQQMNALLCACQGKALYYSSILWKTWYDAQEKLGIDFSTCRDGFDFVNFGHLVSGYDAGYYAYVCCAAIAQDLYRTCFAEDPWRGETWQEYKRLLLAFLGRAVEPDALVWGW